MIYKLYKVLHILQNANITVLVKLAKDDLSHLIFLVHLNVS